MGHAFPRVLNMGTVLFAGVLVDVTFSLRVLEIGIVLFAGVWNFLLDGEC